MRWLAFLSVLAACGAAPVRARDCPSSWVLVRAQGRCGDLRGGWSGYWVLVIVDGPHRGTTVIEPYGDSRGTSQVANWNIARVDLRPTTGATGWDNGCSQLTGEPPTYGGTVVAIESFATEVAARLALAAKPCGD